MQFMPMFKKTRYVTRYNLLQNVTTPSHYIALAKNVISSNERFLERYERNVTKIT